MPESGADASDVLVDAGDAGNAPPSCAGGGHGLSDCGPDAESCCATLLVPGGTFYRGYDGVTSTDQGFPATVSSFQLDRFEVTVGRFRQFVSAVLQGWTPAPGSGKHAHLDGGAGLNGGTEPGWDPSWTGNLATTASGWTTNLSCNATYQTWSLSPGFETKPINCITWYEAYAFCIWDGGFLPSEAEWNYAASGGSEQRVYPWSNPPTSSSCDCSYANYDPNSVPCATTGLTAVGALSPKGDGKWGHADLAGNVWEFVLDWYAPYAVQCTDCADLSGTGSRADRGGGAGSTFASRLLTSFRSGSAPGYRLYDIGVRCARPP